jgi:hypothetical protein
LATCDPKSVEVEQMSSRLRRMCAQTLTNATDTGQVTALMPVLLFASSGDDVSPPIATALTTCLQRAHRTAKRTAATSATETETQAHAWLEAITPLISQRRAAGPLFDAVLDLIEADAKASQSTSALLALSAQWRQVAYDGLQDDRLTRLSRLLPTPTGDPAAGATSQEIE